MSVEGRVLTAATVARWTRRREVWRQEAAALGQELRQARRLAGMNQGELGALVGTTQGEVSAVELGLRARGQTLRLHARTMDALGAAPMAEKRGAAH